MIQLLIFQPDKKTLKAKLPDGEYSVGSAEQCQIRLNFPGVSPIHCRFVVEDDNFYVADLQSLVGTFINGNLLQANELYQVNHESDIAIGSVSVSFKPLDNEIKTPKVEKTPAVEKKVEKSPELDNFGKEKIPILKISNVSDKDRPIIQEIKKLAHKELLDRLNVKKMAVTGVNNADLEAQAKKTIAAIMNELNVDLPSGLPKGTIEQELLHEAIGLGPLEYLLREDDITEIMVNGPDNVYVERGGVLYKTDTAFADNYQVQAAIERIVSPLGRRIDESSPMVDARLADGSRVNAVIPPLSLVGPSITIRKFSKKPLEASDLVRFGSISEDIVDFLATCIKLRKNVIISGGTGSGKTTLLNVLSSFLPNRERIITIEDAAELQLHQEHLVRLESRPANVEGRGEITIRDLVRNSLRMRPDRIVVGECRGGEALDMLQAMNTGHDGSLTTVHANSPRDALARLETLVMMAGFDLPLKAIREQIASAIHIVVQISRERDGSRKVTHVSEITKMEGDVITMQDIFLFRHDGWSEDGKMLGKHVPTGSVPSFMEDIERAKLQLDINMFNPQKAR